MHVVHGGAVQDSMASSTPGIDLTEESSTSPRFNDPDSSSSGDQVISTDPFTASNYPSGMLSAPCADYFSFGPDWDIGTLDYSFIQAQFELGDANMITGDVSDSCQDSLVSLVSESQVFEKSQFSKEVGAAISAPPNSSRILDYFGFDFSRAKATPAESLVYNNDAEDLGDKTVLSLLDYKSKYGFAWHFFHRVDLHDELRKLATEPTPSRKGFARLHLATPVSSIDLDGTIHFPDGTTVKKDLVVAADGVRSSFISTVLGEEIPSQHFMTMTRLLLPTEQMANDADTNAFFKGGYNSIRVLRVDDGSLVTYGCRNGALQNIAFMYPAEDAAVNNEEKTDTHPGGFLKKYPAFIQSLASKASGIGEWRLLTRKPLDRFARGRLAVIGDAAHPMPPLRAQGASMAIEDAAALGVFLSRLTTLEDIPTRLEMFNDLRVKRAATVQLMSSQHKWDPRKIPAEYVHYFGEDIPQNDVDLERCSCDHNVIKEAFRMLQKKDEGKLSPAWDAQKAENATIALL
ncbi:6-hydroxynicotinate 3-monooxygenase [Colletotrichum fructicola]|nr:6-hydroxynicotinate 3-monooxygenase [Colletotrichum fructicola]KAF4939018.1 6-hydroxynicotinate 3-monooxygenase [Colletotrichum fructicola]